MKRLISTTVAAVAAIAAVVIMAMASTDTDARPYHRGGGGGGGARVGVYFGAGLLAASPWLYSRPYYYGPYAPYAPYALPDRWTIAARK